MQSVEHLCSIQLTACSHGSSASAELLVKLLYLYFLTELSERRAEDSTSYSENAFTIPCNG